MVKAQLPWVAISRIFFDVSWNTINIFYLLLGRFKSCSTGGKKYVNLKERMILWIAVEKYSQIDIVTLGALAFWLQAVQALRTPFHQYYHRRNLRRHFLVCY